MQRVVAIAIVVEAVLGLLPHLRLRRLSFMSVHWFFAIWLTIELPLHHLVLSIALAVLAVIAKAPLWTLAVAFVACVLHVGHFASARHAVAVFVNALDGFLPKQRRESLLQALEQRQWAFRTVPYPFRPRAVKVVRNVAYGPIKKRNFLDVYAPAAALPSAAPRPVLLQVHGGAWTVSHKGHQAKPLMHALAARGWVCVAINYRLSPRAKFPDHIVDVKRAIAWVKQHIHEFGGDPSRIVITGGSAGAHLSSLAALTANQAIFQPGFEQEDTTVAACVPLYGVYDFLDRNRDRPDRMARLLFRMVMGSTAEAAREEWDRASPLFWIHADAPPFFVIHGSDDCLAWIEEGRRFVAELRNVSKNPVLFAELPDTQHAFDHFHSARAELAVEAVAAFVNEVVDPVALKEAAQTAPPSHASAPQLALQVEPQTLATLASHGQSP